MPFCKIFFLGLFFLTFLGVKSPFSRIPSPKNDQFGRENFSLECEFVNNISTIGCLKNFCRELSIQQKIGVICHQIMIINQVGS